VFWPLQLSSKVAKVSEDSKFPLLGTFGSVSLILTLASKWGCDKTSGSIFNQGIIQGDTLKGSNQDAQKMFEGIFDT